MSRSPDASDDRLPRWTALHATLLIGATGLTLVGAGALPVVLAGGGSIAGLVVLMRHRWTPRGGFGLANGLTALRLLVIASLPLWPWADGVALPVLAALGFLLLLGDGLDGWVARQRGESSPFGAFLDKETDAFFLLMLCLLVVDLQGYTMALVLVGLLRYLFAIALYLGDPPAGSEPRSPAARYLYVTMMVVLLTAFLPIPVLPPLLIGLVGVTLAASFVPYFRWALAGSSLHVTS